MKNLVKSLLGTLLALLIVFGVIRNEEVMAASDSTGKGWIMESGQWKYIKADGSFAKSEWLWLPVEGKSGVYNYKFFNSTGVNIDQFYKENINGQEKSYLSQAGPGTEYYRGWWTNPENGLVYYFRTTSGSRVEGSQYIDGSWRYFRLGSGSQAFGWQCIDFSYWAYFNEKDGSQIIGQWAWLQLDDGQYNWKYFDANGKNIDQFRKEAAGVWLSQVGPQKSYYKGWWTDPENEQKYYFRMTSGSRVEGRQCIDGEWYYFRVGSGTQAFGKQAVNGVWKYYDDKTGVEIDEGLGSAGDGSSNGGYPKLLSSSEITYNYDTGWYYPWGQCTWGVKVLAPWASNYWGNAYSWASRAAADGFRTGTVPEVGSIICWSGGHVAYVIGVESPTSIQVLEANYNWNPNIANYRGWFNPLGIQGSVTYIYPNK